MPGFIKVATVAVASGIGVGSVFYVLGGVASRLFMDISPTIMSVIGFTCAFAIALLEEEKK